MKVNRWVDGAAAYSWRLLVIVAAAVGILWLLAQLWVVVTALVIVALVTRVLAGPAAWLRRKLPPALAAAVTLLAFLVGLAAVFTTVGSAVAGQLPDIADTVGAAVDDIEDWLVDDAPFEVSRSDVNAFRAGLGETVSGSVRHPSRSLVSGALVAVEVLLSLVLGLVLTFFALKDGGRFLAFVRRRVAPDRRETADRMGRRAWTTLGGYLRGAAVLGLVEGVIIGVTMRLVGGELALPIGVITFLTAFVPFVGAIVAGLLAVLVALATAGLPAALIVAVVAIVVQQLDNDLLAPIVYGKALDLHPVVILLAITTGGALLGFAGSVLAVPVTAVVWNAISESRNSRPVETVD
jgi:putative heme transporter